MCVQVYIREIEEAMFGKPLLITAVFPRSRGVIGVDDSDEDKRFSSFSSVLYPYGNYPCVDCQLIDGFIYKFILNKLPVVQIECY